MSVVTNYVMNNIYRESGHGLLEALDVLQHLFDSGDVNQETIIERKIDGERISIKEMLFEKYAVYHNEDIINFLNKNGITKEAGEEESYLALLNLLKSLKNEYIEHIAEEKIKSFMSLNIHPEKIVSYLHSANNAESEKNNPSLFFDLIINNSLNVYLFKVIFEDYLGFENVRKPLEDFIITHVINLTFSSASKTIALCNSYPELREINVKSNRVNGSDMSLLEKLIVESPDVTLQNMDLSESEKMRLVDFFYEKEIISQHILPKNSAINTIKMKKDWFSTCLRDGKTDLVSVLTSKSSQGVGVVLSELKNTKLKQYLKERRENLLVEYLTNNDGRYVKAYLNKIEKHLPELLTRENKKGVIELLLKGFGYGDIKEKEIDLLTNYSSKVLMTSDPEELLIFANKKARVEYNIRSDQQKSHYDKVHSIVMSAVRENFEGKECEKVKEAITKLELQHEITKILRESAIFEKVNQKIEETINNSGLIADQLCEVLSLENLVLSGYLNKNYMTKKRIYEERDVLLNSVVPDEGFKVKKRI